jgi:hypothetical protein
MSDLATRAGGEGGGARSATLLGDPALRRGARAGDVAVARTRAEAERALRLVHHEYLASGYLVRPHPSGLALDLHPLLPGGAVLLVQAGGAALATVTGLADDPAFGLRLDALYRAEADALRSAGRRLVELSALAIARGARAGTLHLHLFRAGLWHAIAAGATDLCAVVHPGHARYYRRVFFFEPFGPVRHHPGVGAPAVALRLDLGRADARLREAYGALPADRDLHAFLYGGAPRPPAPGAGWPPAALPAPEAQALLALRPDLLAELAPARRARLHALLGPAAEPLESTRPAAWNPGDFDSPCADGCVDSSVLPEGC